MPRKILMIAYYFHPDLEVGAVRTVKFAKFLPESDWKAIIVTVKSKYYQKTDPTPLPFECTVERSSKWPTVGDCYLWAKKMLRSVRGKQSAGSGNESLQSLTSSLQQGGSGFKWKSLFRWIFWTPDYCIGWLFPGIWMGVKVARREKVDLIYASGPPRTGHWIAWVVSLITGKPLVADFRDPLVVAQRPEKFTTRLAWRFECWMERRTVNRSILVMTTTPEFRDVLKKQYYPVLETNCQSVINGFDIDDFPGAAPEDHDPKETIHFLYAGTLYEGRDPRQFVVALGELVSSGFLQREGIVVDFYGPIEIDTTSLQGIIEQCGLADVIQFKALVKRSEYLRLIGSADVLLLLQSNLTPTEVPAKTFEYLATGNEILAMAPPGATANILKGYENVQIAHPEDHVAIKSAIQTIVTRLRSGSRDRSKSLQSLKHLYKRELTRDFARLLDDAVARSKSKP